MASVSLFLLTMVAVNIAICGPQCPPGGRYLDRHLGMNGRWMCCSELCVPRTFRDQCRKKCPNYEVDKRGNAEAARPDPKAVNILGATNDPHPSSIAHFIIIPIAAVLIIIIAVVAKLGHWQGVSAIVVGYWHRIRPGDPQTPEQHAVPGPDQAPPESAVLPQQDAESTRPLLEENQPEELGDDIQGGPCRGGRSNSSRATFVWYHADAARSEIAHDSYGVTSGRSGMAGGRSAMISGRSEVAVGHSGMTEECFGTAEGRSGMDMVRSGMDMERSGMAEGRSGINEGRPGITEGRAGMAEGRSGIAEGRSGMAEGRSGIAEESSGMVEGRSGIADGRVGMAEVRSEMAEGRYEMADRRSGSGPLDDGQPGPVNEGAHSPIDAVQNPPVHQSARPALHRHVKAVQVEDDSETVTCLAL